MYQLYQTKKTDSFSKESVFSKNEFFVNVKFIVQLQFRNNITYFFICFT